MTSNRHVALGQLPDRYGLHPSAFDYAAACIRLHTLFAGNTAHTSTRKNGNNRMQPNATKCKWLRESTDLESPSVLLRKSSLPYQARGSRAGAVRCPLRMKT